MKFPYVLLLIIILLNIYILFYSGNEYIRNLPFGETDITTLALLTLFSVIIIIAIGFFIGAASR